MKTKMTIWWGLAVLSAGLAVAWRLAPLPDAGERLEWLEAGAGRKWVELGLNETEREFFGPARVERRVSAGGGAPVVVTVVDGSRRRRVVHDPEFCFRGAGWGVAEERAWPLPHGEGRWVRLVDGDGKQLEALYWFSDGRRAFASPLRYWRETTWRRLTLGRSGPEPVLVLLVPAGDGAVDWRGWLERWPQVTRL